jgi:glycyl-tRNA synthetase
MEDIVSLCKRRGFIFQSSEIYGGINGFWDYGPLGVELKRNVREAWWRDMITNHDDLNVPAGAPSAFQMVGVETSIIMHPQVWKAVGHYDQFHDLMVDCRESKKRYRFDHLKGRWAKHRDVRLFFTTDRVAEEGLEQVEQNALKYFGLRKKDAEKIEWGTGPHGGLHFKPGAVGHVTSEKPFEGLRRIWDADKLENIVAPDATKPGTLTEPREFNLMFKTILGALGTEEDTAFLRPETAQGMFVNFKNILDSTRLKVPFGVAQIGKSFRNEITPRNYTFRSREFEQMEMEFFCHPDESRKWYEYWRDRRYAWYVRHGITSDNLILRDHTPEELSHYSVGTADVEYAFPFLEPGEYGELEGVAHRGNFDLRSHMEGKLVKDENGCLVVERDANGQPKYRGSGKDLTYYDDEAFLRDKDSLGLKSFKEYCERRKDEADPGAPYRYIPHVIEPAAGADRATLAFLCEAYDVDEAPDDSGKMQSRTVMRLHPKLAPIKAAVFPLIKKDGMPETAAKIYGDLKRAGIAAYYDQQAAIGRRYRRQDEIGTPFCITVDGETANDGCVTVRNRDTLEQTRVPIPEVVDNIRERL